jgi:lipid-A-disaccharide synthase-like uncharacterized protein
MKLEFAQDLVIIGGGAFLMWAGVVAKDPLNIVLSGLFLLFGLAALYLDVRRNIR